MIVGNINELGLNPWLSPKITEALDYVLKNINADSPAGKYDIVGENVWVMVIEGNTRLAAEALPEYHEKYLDIQIVLAGQEGMAFSLKPPHTEVIEDKLAGSDIAFIKTPDDETMITMNAADFIIFYPGEVHKPLCVLNGNVTSVKKAVIKIAKDYL
ncbi:YhcH/YjgK/YiaL family protein [Cedecea neteri]|uniref:YhcH/YjgK/YiaL family protein n=1 Tax=Cedecea neteri TaxID=158822 RepID=UPI0004F70C60|nr:YhcH/YjgK/YiaL family protein [Cedecea neteri]AIR66522.1 hypothetical protein LH86_15905 [Cedecea neteri]